MLLLPLPPAARECWRLLHAAGPQQQWQSWLPPAPNGGPTRQQLLELRLVAGIVPVGAGSRSCGHLEALPRLSGSQLCGRNDLPR